MIKCKFLKDGKPSGREYAYLTPETVKVGDMVQINSSAKGVVTAVDVPDEEVDGFAGKIKTITGKISQDIVFKGWSILNVDKDSFQAPELQPKYLQGYVSNHPTFEKGSFIRTSPIDDILDCGDHKEIVTRTGSRYQVYPADVNPYAEKQYPGYYERLKMNKGDK